MDDTKFTICRLCLETIQNGSFKLFKNIELNMLDLLIPKDICINSGSAMCRACLKNLLNCYEFKSVCLEMNERKRNLEVEILTNVKVCSLCFENIEDEMMREIFLGVKGTLLTIMLERCLPELNTRHLDMAGCTKCFKSLEMMFSFINKWLITEEKLEKYCRAKNINKNEIKLLKVIRFFQSYSGNIAHPQIENSRISSNYGDSTSRKHLVISNIKLEPGQNKLNNTARNEEALKDFSHRKVKLEPVEIIDESMGRSEESYLQNTLGVFKRNKHEDQKNERKDEKRCLSPSFSDENDGMGTYREFTNNKDVNTIEQYQANMEEGLLSPDSCRQDPSALAMPDFSNLSQATRRESRRWDLDDDPDKKRRKSSHSTAANPKYKSPITDRHQPLDTASRHRRRSEDRPIYLPVDRFDLCWRCGYPGHSRGSCREEKRMFCSRCGLLGVLSKNCRCPSRK